MGKRVTVTRERVPTIRVDKLRHEGEAQARQLGVMLPGFIYVLLIGLGFGLNLLQLAWFVLGWLALGWFFLVALLTAQRGKLLKGNTRNKVTGTAYQELRLMINRLCRMLDIKSVPETYVIESHEVGGMVRGLGAPYMVISSRLLSLLSAKELEAQIATMLGHVKARNVRWRTFVQALADGGGFVKLLCGPYTVVALLGKSFVDYSRCTADTLALLCMDGDTRLLSRTIIKVIARTSHELTEEQAAQLEAFLDKQGLEARAEDVELQYLLGQMTRAIPWLRERLESLYAAPESPAFREALALMRERVEQLQLARG